MVVHDAPLLHRENALTSLTLTLPLGYAVADFFRDKSAVLVDQPQSASSRFWSRAGASITKNRTLARCG